MRFVIYGAGGIGGTIGARLFLAGYEVLLIARGEHLRSIQTDGMRFVTPSLDKHINIPAVGHPKEAALSDNDVVIMCMKGQHTEDALRELYAHAPDSIAVVSCQNGVANERAALRRFRNVYGMVVLLPAEHLEPGLVVNFAEDKAGVLDVGRYPFGSDNVAVSIAEAVENSGFSCRSDDRVMRHKYAKLVINLNNAVEASTGGGFNDLSRTLRQEAFACYEAAGIECATVEETRDRRGGIKGGTPRAFKRHGGSSLQSIMRGTGDIETDYLNGEIVQLGRLYGVPTPANAVIQRIGNTVARRSLKPGAYSVDDLLELIAVESKDHE